MSNESSSHGYGSSASSGSGSRDRDRGDRGDRGDRDGGSSYGSRDRENQPPAFGAIAVAPGERSAKQNLIIDYKNIDDLRRVLTSNGKIISRKRAGLSARDQSRVAQAIKRARFMALIPYASLLS